MFDVKPYNRKNAVSSYNPFHEMEEMERNFFNDPFSFFDSKSLSEFKSDITDNGAEYLIETDLPGFGKDDITLDIENDVLTIKAERHSDYEDKDKKGKYLRCERSYGMYQRKFDISNIDTDNIKAKYENGVLKLNLPKKAPTENTKKKLEIE